MQIKCARNCKTHIVVASDPVLRHGVSRPSEKGGKKRKENMPKMTDSWKHRVDKYK